MKTHKVTLCGPCGNAVCYEQGCIKEKQPETRTIDYRRLKHMSFVIKIMADQPLSTEEGHPCVDADDYVEAMQQQADEMMRIDDAIRVARKLLGRP